MSAYRIIVTGLIAQYPMGGVTWDYLQHLLGLTRLGHDVYYLEDSGQWPYDPVGEGLSNDCTYNVRYLAGVMAGFGLADRWAYRFPLRSQWFGLEDGKRRQVVQSADLLINLSCTLRRPEDYRKVRRLIFIDTDPVFTQVKLARGQADFRKLVDAHDRHFTFGERFSGAVPSTGHYWRATRQPICLSEWRPKNPRRDVFTTVMSWKSCNPITYGGRTYGQKDVEMTRFLELPSMVGPAVLEVAFNAGKTRQPPRDLLAHRGWRVVHPSKVCPDLHTYRAYIESSMAEWSVAKNGYVVGQPGWFSCRSACYLAAGRPVVVQDTGFASVLPVGEGLLSFTQVEEAADAIREVRGNYERHAKAAHAIAQEYFDSDKVLSRLIEEAIASDDE